MGHPLLEALETYRRFLPETSIRGSSAGSTLGDSSSEAGPSLVWAAEPASGNDYAFQSAHRYAVLASVSLNYSLAQIAAKMTSLGFVVTYAWEQGQPTRGLYAIDAWLASLPVDATENHRWVYGEANFAGADTTLAIDAPWPLTIYHVAQVFEAVPAPPAGAPLPSLPVPASVASAPAAPGPSGTEILVAAGVGATLLGLGWWVAARFL